MDAYLLMNNGSRAGTAFPLDPDTENPIGRGAECSIAINDPLCSRVHALLVRRGETWYLRDAESRNGTFACGERIEEAALQDGHALRVGSTEFTFHDSEQADTATTPAKANVTQTIVMDTPVGPGDTANLALGPVPDQEQAQELLLLYQLSIKLLGCDEPNEVIQIALELLGDRVKAEVVGFLWMSDDGQLEPKIVIPRDAAERVTLSESLTRLVTEQGHALWIANQTLGESATKTQSLMHYADAVCIPLLHQGTTLGAIHAYLERGRFRQSDFDFAISAANILSVALARARQQTSLETDYRRLVAKSPGYDELIGQCKPMLELKSKIARVAKASGCVLVRGESGTGKELVARAIHRASPRADRPMLSVNCAAIPADLMESQLFGHKKGAFTGADREHPGFFRQADLGTLFLDEVGEMTLAGQAKLLRILEGHPFLPVGATEEIRVDVRLIAATNQNLQTYVREKRFRDDLYYRLSVFELHVPPLRERGDDIGRLVDFFLDSFCNQHGRPNLSLADEARAKLLSYNWPGNVRQLRNVIDSAVVLAEDDQIQPGDLGLFDSGAGELDTLEIEHWERKLIKEALKRTSGNVPEAAKLLGLGRATLYRKVEQYGISR